MKLTPPALSSATKGDFTEWAASFKLFKVQELPDFIFRIHLIWLLVWGFGDVRVNMVEMGREEH